MRRRIFITLFCISVFTKLFANDFSLSVTKTDASCHGASDGKAEVTVLSNSNPPYTYSWNTGATTALVTGLPQGAYSVTVTDAVMNDTTVSVTIMELPCELVAELVFTPNNDGVNDVWNIYNSEYYPEFLLLVYNRWGQKVYQQTGAYEPWDGKNSGFNVPDATYYFVIYKNKSDSEILLKGSVSIVR